MPSADRVRFILGIFFCYLRVFVCSCYLRTYQGRVIPSISVATLLPTAPLRIYPTLSSAPDDMQDLLANVHISTEKKLLRYVKV